MPTAWYALIVRPRHEKAVFDHMKGLQYDAFLPLYRSRRRWADRMKEVDLPLFPGYVFCVFSYRRRVPVLRVPGVRAIVTAGKDPAPVPDTDINALRKMVNSGAPLQPWPYLKTGQRIVVKAGPLCGIEGVVLQVKKTWHVVVSVNLLQRSVAAELDRSLIEPVCLRKSQT